MSERRRDFVRLEIERAGMDLFAERGYDSVTVQQIAEAAGIGRRTFFRHFRSREELLMAYDTRLATRALRAFERRPLEEAAAIALSRAFISTAEMRPDEERVAFQRNKVLQDAGADTLIAGPPDLSEAFLAATAARLHTHSGTDIQPHVVMWTVFAAARAASRFWVASNAERPLQTYLETAFDQLLSGLDHDGASARARGGD